MIGIICIAISIARDCDAKPKRKIIQVDEEISVPTGITSGEQIFASTSAGNNIVSVPETNAPKYDNISEESPLEEEEPDDPPELVSYSEEMEFPKLYHLEEEEDYSDLQPTSEDKSHIRYPSDEGEAIDTSSEDEHTNKVNSLDIHPERYQKGKQGRTNKHRKHHRHHRHHTQPTKPNRHTRNHKKH